MEERPAKRFCSWFFLDIEDEKVVGIHGNKYDLIGVVNHLGSFGGGHYVALGETYSFQDKIG